MARKIEVNYATYLVAAAAIREAVRYGPGYEEIVLPATEDIRPVVEAIIAASEYPDDEPIIVDGSYVVVLSEALHYVALVMEATGMVLIREMEETR